MTRNHIVIDAAPSKVYDVLMDASCYPRWVVGAKDLRGTDPGWPRKGTRFHHRVGAGIANLEDWSRIVDKKPNRRVVLDAQFRPLGAAKITLDLRPKARGSKTHVTMTEQPKGPVRWVWNPVASAGLKARNALSLRRLRRLVASR
jgi:uncharacterized protein YndB with AHSA1/START domain